jgi:histidine kinase
MQPMDFTILETIFEGPKHTIFRAEDQNKQRVILKVLNTEHPTEVELNRLQNEFRILEKLKSIKGIAEVIGLGKFKSKYTLVFKNSEGNNLETSIKGKIPLYTFYKIAKSAVTALEKIHENKIIHRDIKPSNILYDPQTGEVEIIDFGSSIEVDTAFPSSKTKEIIDGSLAYVSPEQTGRINRQTDTRSDYYSLGATFYHLLTGKPPFSANDPMDMIYSHIAKEPLAPTNIESSIPENLSKIILKLLSKDPETRYQSSYGILYDLEWISSNQYNTDEFIVGKKDFSSEFHIPQKLYGRQNEIKSLVDTFYHMYQHGKPQLSVITGVAGIGKSALVKEIYKPISEARGYFISGEYEQFTKSLPFSGLIKAFSNLIQILLTETSEEIENWRRRIVSQLGSNAKIVVDVIPQLELIIGEQQSVAALDSQENATRFYSVFQSFIRVFCTLNHPLILFLDDLQWIDTASLQMIKNLMSDTSLRYIFIILSFRTSEESQNHSFLDMIDSLKKEKIYPITIRLKELKANDINQLLMDCLFANEEEVKNLSELILNKTAGNPFFVNELLKELSREKIIYPNHEKGKWLWDLEEIKHTNISENIIDLLISKIKRQSSKSQDILKMAACIGSTFDLWILSIIRNQSYQETMDSLKELIREDFIYLPESSIQRLNQFSLNSLKPDQAKLIVYQFQHDRIQQAAYELLEEEENKNLQLTIGRIMWGENYSDDILFDLTNHLNIGSEKIIDPIERERLIALNLNASKKAKLSTAYELSLHYLNHALSQVDKFTDPWNEIFSLTKQVYRELTELYYLNVQFEKMEESISIFLKHTHDLSEVMHSYRLLINYYTTVSNFEKAIHAGMEAMKYFNIILPTKDISSFTEKEFKKIEHYRRGHSVESLLSAPEMKDESKKLALEIMSNLMPAAYLYNSELWTYIVVKSVNSILENGISDQAYSLSGYGIILGSIFNDYKTGHAFAILALKIAEKHQNKSEITKTASVVANFTLPFREHLKNAAELNRKCLEVGKESGELQHLSYSLVFNIINLFFTSKNLLSILNDTIPKHMILCKQAKSSIGKDTINAVRIVLMEMTTSSEDKMELEVINEYAQKFLLEWKENRNYITVFIFKTLRILIFFLQENYEDAYNQVMRAEKYLEYATGTYTVCEYNLYASLTLCALSTNADPIEKEQYITKVKAYQKQMKAWSKFCSENFLHKYLLVEAELARLSGHFWRASKLYDEAIAEAHKNEFLHMEAVANELCANLYMHLGKTKIMRSYMMEAHYLYSRWGSIEKVNQIEKKFPDIFPKTNRRKANSDLSDNTMDARAKFTHPVSLLDLNAVIKASQALAEEIVLEKLLKKIMRILFENAGAEKGLFIKIHNDDFFILANGNSAEEEIEVSNTNSALEKAFVNQDIVPYSLINYVKRIKKHIVLRDASKEDLFINDPYLRKWNPKSILCYPVLRHDSLIGIIYLENNYTVDAFTRERLEVLSILSTQIAISIENSELYANLEAKVEERTANLNHALKEVQVLKEKQDADYFLTSLLIEPLGKNNIQTDAVQIEFLIEQKKKFIFKNKELEIGGDLCTTDRIFLNNRSYIVVLNADAMGKSIQGAGGILVLGSVFKSILQRTHSISLGEHLYPEKWIKNSFLEMQRIFESFDGYMLISLVLGLLDEENGVLYFINVEHPKITLYRNRKAKFIEKVGRKYRKMGIQGINSPIQISLFQMLAGDVLIIGSDGRDDIIIDRDENGLEVLNFDEDLFLESVEAGNGNLKEISLSIKAKGELNDDLSLLRVSFKELEVIKEEDRQKEEKEFLILLNQLEEKLEFQKTNKDYPALIKTYEELIELQPLDKKSILQLSLLLFKLKNYDRFIHYAELIKLRSPAGRRNLFRLIVALMRVKNFPRANSLILEVLAINPLNRKAKILEQIMADILIKSV